MSSSCHDYIYSIKRMLNNHCEDLHKYRSISCICYSVNTESIYPFLRFLLSNSQSEDLKFPFIQLSSSITNDNVVNHVKVYLSGLLHISNYEAFSESLLFDGFFISNNVLYVFMNMTNCIVDVVETYVHHHSSSPVRYALLDEILDHRHVCGIPINTTITSFFLTHHLATQLYDMKHESSYETPIVAYVGKTTYEQLNYVAIFGENGKNRSAMMGPYYYFTNFVNAFQQGGWRHRNNTVERCINGGIVRFALFMGATKFVENMPKDINDTSIIKQTRLSDPILSASYELATIKISDHDGKWSHIYDSVYVGRLEVERNIYVEDSPMYVIKDKCRHLPLSFHAIDVRTLGEKFDYDNNDYKLV